MANTLTNINPEVIAQEGFEAYKAMLTNVEAFSTSFNGDAKNKNDTIWVPVASASTAGNFSGDYTDSDDGTITGTSVALSTHVVKSFHVTDAQAGNTPYDVFGALAKEAAYSVAKSIWQAALAKFTSATFGDVEGTSSYAVASASVVVDDIAILKKMLLKRNALGKQSMICNLDVAGSLWKDTPIQDASALGSDEFIREGKLTRPILGVNIYWTNAVPTSWADDNTTAVMCVPSAVALAVRPVSAVDATQAGNAGTIIIPLFDADSGIALSYRQFYDNRQGALYGVYEAIYGCAAVQTTGAVRLVTDNNSSSSES